jgi:hypothetical protein
MAMDRGAVAAIVGRELGPLKSRLGIDHWDIEVTYGYIEGDVGCTTKGRCRRQVDYDRATIEIDPEAHDDEADVLKTLRHELFHVVLAPYDLYTYSVDKAGLDSPINAVLDRVWGHACEKAVIRLEKMYQGLMGSTADR